MCVCVCAIYYLNFYFIFGTVVSPVGDKGDTQTHKELHNNYSNNSHSNITSAFPSSSFNTYNFEIQKKRERCGAQCIMGDPFLQFKSIAAYLGADFNKS